MDPGDPVSGRIADGPTPPAWVWAAIAGLLVAACSWLWNEGLHAAATPLERYLADRAAALDTGEPVTDEVVLELARDKLAVQAGADLFSRHCSKCHGGRGEGSIGPNLTDRFWIGGGSPFDIYQTILLGRDGKGMPAWGLQLGTGTVKQLTAYVVTIRDTDVPGKAPQGARYESTPSPR